MVFDESNVWTSLKNNFIIKFILYILFVFSSLNILANGDTFLNLDSCKFCVKTINAVQIPIFKSKIHFTPLAAWNNYDKSMLGIAFYSKPKLKNIDFVFIPMFAVGSKNIVGIADFKYTFPLQKIKSLDFGLKSKRFSYLVFPEDLAYNKIEPFININLNNSKKNHKRTVGFKSSLVFLEYIYKGRQTDFYYVNNLFFKYNFNKKKDDFWFQIDFKQSNTFASISTEINKTFDYKTPKKNAFYFRFFAGSFLYNKKNNPKIIPLTPNAKFLLSSNNSSYLGTKTNAFTQYQKDYTFSNFYFDRNAQDPFFSRQIGSYSDGGFKTLTNIGNSNKYLLTINMSTDIPIPLPIEPWLNFAMIEDVNPKFVAEFGASVNFMNKFIQFHFPIATTKNLTNKTFFERMSFSIDLTKLDKLRKY